MSDASGPVPNLRPKHDLAKVVSIVLAIAGALYAAADKLVAMGRSSAALDVVQEMRRQQAQDHDDLGIAKAEIKAANVGVQEIKGDIKDINVQLRQLNLTNARHR